MNKLPSLLVVFIISGCSILNPYHDNSMCLTKDEFGKCVTVTEAYEASKNGDVNPEPQYDNFDTNDQPDDDQIPEIAEGEKRVITPIKSGFDRDEQNYRRQLYREMATLLGNPKTPMVKPPKIRRILITSYDDNDVLYMPRYVFIMVDHGGWVMKEIDNPSNDVNQIELFLEHEK